VIEKVCDRKMHLKKFNGAPKQNPTGTNQLQIRYIKLISYTYKIPSQNFEPGFLQCSDFCSGN